MSFFKNYSQNGAAQALVVLSALTVVAEVVRNRSTKKRPYRDYGVGGMNEYDNLDEDWTSDQDMLDESYSTMTDDDDEMDMMIFDQMIHGQIDQGPPEPWHETSHPQIAHQQTHEHAAHQQGRHHAHQQAARQQIHGQGVRQQAHGQEGRHQAYSQGARQQVRIQEQEIEGSMARAATPWNRYVATEVPRLMAKGMTAPEAMKAASKSFRRKG